jgi:hypothetical protein
LYVYKAVGPLKIETNPASKYYFIEYELIWIEEKVKMQNSSDATLKTLEERVSKTTKVKARYALRNQ